MIQYSVMPFVKRGNDSMSFTMSLTDTFDNVLLLLLIYFICIPFYGILHCYDTLYRCSCVVHCYVDYLLLFCGVVLLVMQRRWCWEMVEESVLIVEWSLLLLFDVENFWYIWWRVFRSTFRWCHLFWCSGIRVVIQSIVTLWYGIWKWWWLPVDTENTLHWYLLLFMSVVDIDDDIYIIVYVYDVMMKRYC